MPDYKMDIRGKLGLGDKNDNFTITLDQSNRQHVNIITSMLKESNFCILEEGINNLGDYYINANKYK